MRFTGFEDGDPPSQSYTVDDGLSISVVDSAFGEIKAKAFINRDRVNKFFYVNAVSYGNTQSDADTDTKHEHAETLLEEALSYQQEIEQSMRDLRDRVARSVPNDVDVSSVRTNRESEVERDGDDSVYVFHVTATYRNRTHRIYVGDTALKTDSKTSFRYAVRSEDKMTATETSEGQVPQKLKASIRQWEGKF